MNHSWIDPRVVRVKVAGAKAYLLRHGWRQKPFPRPEVLVFEGPMADDGTPLTQRLPAAEHYTDYRMCMEDLIGTLGAIENRYAVEILDEMLALSATNGAVEHPIPENVAG
jgi:hypothetical protein